MHPDQLVHPDQRGGLRLEPRRHQRVATTSFTDSAPTFDSKEFPPSTLGSPAHIQTAREWRDPLPGLQPCLAKPAFSIPHSLHTSTLARCATRALNPRCHHTHHQHNRPFLTNHDVWQYEWCAKHIRLPDGSRRGPHWKRTHASPCTDSPTPKSAWHSAPPSTPSSHDWGASASCADH
jgi:hypothetical protein